MSAEFTDPYIDPKTGILRNLVGATAYDELSQAEGEFAAFRMSELFERGTLLFPTGTLEDFCTIHQTLFQDIYDWAGCIRTVEIRKNTQEAEFFLPSANIPTGIEWSRKELEQDSMLRNMVFDRFVERLAYHYDNYNYVHPFREGNGRTQRIFWSLLCHNAGYDLDWRGVSGEENDEASRMAAEERDYAPLVKMFSKVARPCNPDIPINKDLINPEHLHD